MGNYSNVSVVILTPYSFISVSITTVILQVIGVIFNAAFIHISRKGSDKHTDVTLLLACSTQIGQALVTLVKSIFVLVCEDDNTALQWYFIFEPMDFLFRGLYIWLSLSLSTARYFVLKKIEIPNNNLRVRSKIRQWLPIPIVLVASCIFLFMITVEIPDISRYVTLYFLQVAIIGIPMLSFVILTTLLVLYTLKVVYKRKNMIGQCLETTSSIHKSQQSVTRKLLQQAINSLLYHIVFMALPYSYVVIIDICVDNWLTNGDILTNQKLIYHYARIILPIFNPISLGIFLKKHRKSIQSFWKAILISTERTRSLEPIPESQELQIVPEEINISIESQKKGSKDMSNRRLTTTSTSDHCSVISRQSRLSTKDPLYCTPDFPFVETDLEIDTLSVYSGYPYDDRCEAFLSNITYPTTFGTRQKLHKKSSFSKSRLSDVSISSYTSSSGRSTMSVGGSNRYGSLKNVPSLQHSISIQSNQSIEEVVQDTMIYF
ncbi:OLFR [Mytilus coruscus]|uniref:OLFR n=1 Tax=Mytilus coruscus TaxID=42192 RepID=A0A6J8ELI3_MYTCO|nr:OLFR [Mytilus coruscus]